MLATAIHDSAKGVGAFLHDSVERGCGSVHDSAERGPATLLYDDWRPPAGSF